MFPEVSSNMHTEFTNIQLACTEHKHDLKFKHAAILMRKMKPVTEVAFNYSNGTTSVHAEMAAIENFFSKYNVRRKCVL